jgi:hypothetical protein
MLGVLAGRLDRVGSQCAGAAVLCRSLPHRVPALRSDTDGFPHRSGFGSTENGGSAITRQARSCLLQSANAPLIASRSVAAFSTTPGRPPAPTATALQPPVALPRRRATSFRASGAIAAWLPAWKKPATFVVVGIGTTKTSSTAMIMHGTPALLPHHSRLLRMTSSLPPK